MDVRGADIDAVCWCGFLVVLLPTEGIEKLRFSYTTGAKQQNFYLVIEVVVLGVSTLKRKRASLNRSSAFGKD
jgi:hypothetical protein